MDEQNEWGLVQSYYIDTDAYTDLDRQMFVCGAEFEMVSNLLSEGWTGDRPIHRENESRIRMLCGRVGVHCEIDQHEGYDGCETWSTLRIG